MNYLKYNLPGLWFQVYRQVLTLNESLNKDQLDKVQLREVTTAIFIASTHRGIVRPYTYTRFQVQLLQLTKAVFQEKKKAAILTAVQAVLKERTNRKEVTGENMGAG